MRCCIQVLGPRLEGNSNTHHVWYNHRFNVSAWPTKLVLWQRNVLTTTTQAGGVAEKCSSYRVWGNIKFCERNKGTWGRTHGVHLLHL